MKTFFMGELSPEENLAFFRAFWDVSVFPDEGKQATAHADMYRQTVDHPEKALYRKFTVEFGRMYEKMQREWCESCIRELEVLLRQKKDRRTEENTK